MRITPLHPFRLLCGLTALAILGAATYMLLNKEQKLSWKHKTTRYVLTIKNKGNALIENSELLAFSPLAETSHQRLVSLSTSEPYVERTDNYGNRILAFRITLAPYATKEISIQANLEVTDGSHQVSLRDKERYLIAEKYVERDAPEIEAILRQIDPNTPVITPKQIYSWLKDSVKDIGYIREDRGALHAAKSKEGDCTEFGYLFVALARRVGIPARLVGGFVLPTSGGIAANSYHNWAEFFEEGSWHIADPQKGNFKTSQSEYIAFRIIGQDETTPLVGSERFLSFSPELEVRLR